ncbi:hypothetical protein OTU49_005652 [Cherax quadricarinatus]|uniref:DNA repair nuclease/redox regulator APEX1 n=1 Tax=Cherax quadricarinatus TaxID=27406 RepID=A0AAW0X4G3_CHEQU
MPPKRKKESSENGKEKDTKKVRTEDFSSDAETKDGKKWNLKIVSWNVDGLRAWLEKDGMSVFEHENPDIVCLQETKCAIAKLPNDIKDINGYKSYFMSAKLDGYSGVGLISKLEPLVVTYGIKDKAHDDEGRCITAEYEKFYLVTVYLANPKANKKNAGFTKEERDSFTDLLSAGFVDSFRHLYPDATAKYTFWTYMMNCRAKNIGWRLDYFVLSERLVPQLCDSLIRDTLTGSDHCPITLLMHM